MSTVLAASALLISCGGGDDHSDYFVPEGSNTPVPSTQQVPTIGGTITYPKSRWTVKLINWQPATMKIPWTGKAYVATVEVCFGTSGIFPALVLEDENGVHIPISYTDSTNVMLNGVDITDINRRPSLPAGECGVYNFGMPTESTKKPVYLSTGNSVEDAGMFKLP